MRTFKKREEALDDALRNTFPASDPISMIQPGADRPEHETDRPNPVTMADKNVRPLALHPPIWLRGSESIRSLSDLAKALVDLAPLDPSGTAALRIRVDQAMTPQAANSVGRDFREWAKARQLLQE